MPAGKKKDHDAKAKFSSSRKTGKNEKWTKMRQNSSTPRSFMHASNATAVQPCVAFRHHRCASVDVCRCCYSFMKKQKTQKTSVGRRRSIQSDRSLNAALLANIAHCITCMVGLDSSQKWWFNGARSVHWVWIFFLQINKLSIIPDQVLWTRQQNGVRWIV